MSNEELVLAIHQGDEGKLLELWEQIEGLARSYANKYARALMRGGVDTNAAEMFDDFLYGCGYPALVAAVNSYDGEAGSAFSTWYSYYFKQEVYRLRGWRWRDGKTIQTDAAALAVSLNAPTGEDGDAELQDFIPDECSQASFEDAERQIFNDQLHDALETALNTLPDIESKAIRGSFYDGLTMQAMAARDGVSSEQVRSCQAKGLRHIRQGKTLRKLHAFAYPDSDVYAAGLRGTGLLSFKNSGMSATERAAFAIIERRLQ
ncbi:MAG: sigma-70 family RNA polymerase sigma factor [Oscillospiraceae bacterium]|nr:sigma-70 family RNA polymerase sigma factor [Oscillospiraceae bacterium]